MNIEQPNFKVYKYSQNAQFKLFTTDNKDDAKRFCEQHNWELKDENDFIWNLDYAEITHIENGGLSNEIL